MLVYPSAEFDAKGPPRSVDADSAGYVVTVIALGRRRQRDEEEFPWDGSFELAPPKP